MPDATSFQLLLRSQSIEDEREGQAAGDTWHRGLRVTALGTVLPEDFRPQTVFGQGRVDEAGPDMGPLGDWLVKTGTAIFKGTWRVMTELARPGGAVWGMVNAMNAWIPEPDEPLDSKWVEAMSKGLDELAKVILEDSVRAMKDVPKGAVEGWKEGVRSTPYETVRKWVGWMFHPSVVATLYAARGVPPPPQEQLEELQEWAMDNAAAVASFAYEMLFDPLNRLPRVGSALSRIRPPRAGIGLWPGELIAEKLDKVADALRAHPATRELMAGIGARGPGQAGRVIEQMRREAIGQRTLIEYRARPQLIEARRLAESLQRDAHIDPQTLAELLHTDPRLRFYARHPGEWQAFLQTADPAKVQEYMQKAADVDRRHAALRAALPAEAKQAYDALVDHVKQLQNYIETIHITQGPRVEFLREPIAYFTRELSPEVKEAMRLAGRGETRTVEEYTTRIAPEFERILPDKSPVEINRLWREYLEKGAEASAEAKAVGRALQRYNAAYYARYGTDIPEVFLTDPIHALAVRVGEAAMAAASHSYFVRAVQNFGWATPVKAKAKQGIVEFHPYRAVRAGETLAQIARRYGVDVEDIIASNRTLADIDPFIPAPSARRLSRIRRKLRQGEALTDEEQEILEVAEIWREGVRLNPPAGYATASVDFYRAAEGRLGGGVQAIGRGGPIFVTGQVAFPEELVPYLERAASVLVPTDQTFNLVTRFLDWWRRAWVLTMLPLRPAYNARNVVSTAYIGATLGGMDVRDFAAGFAAVASAGPLRNMAQESKIAQLEAVLGKGALRVNGLLNGGKIDLGQLGQKTPEEVYELALKYGVPNSGFYGTERSAPTAHLMREVSFIPTETERRLAAERAAAIAQRQPQGRLEQLQQKAQQAVVASEPYRELAGAYPYSAWAAQQVVEDAVRIGLWARLLRQGFSPQEATEWVYAIMGDFHKIPRANLQKWRRVINFINWYRYSWPLAFNMLVTEPGYYARWGRFLDHTFQATEDPRRPLKGSEVYEFVRRNAAMVIGPRGPGQVIRDIFGDPLDPDEEYWAILLGPTFPTMELVNRPPGEVLTSTLPAWAAGIARALGIAVGSRRPGGHPALTPAEQAWIIREPFTGRFISIPGGQATRALIEAMPGVYYFTGPYQLIAEGVRSPGEVALQLILPAKPYALDTIQAELASHNELQEEIRANYWSMNVFQQRANLLRQQGRWEEAELNEAYAQWYAQRYIDAVTQLRDLLAEPWTP